MIGAVKAKIKSIMELAAAEGQAEVKMDYRVGDKQYHASINMMLEDTRALLVGEEYYFCFKEPTKIYSDIDAKGISSSDIEKQLAECERVKAELRRMSEEKVDPSIEYGKDYEVRYETPPVCTGRGMARNSETDSMAWQIEHMINILRSGCLSRKAIDIMFDSLGGAMSGRSAMK